MTHCPVVGCQFRGSDADYRRHLEMVAGTLHKRDQHAELLEEMNAPKVDESTLEQPNLPESPVQDPPVNEINLPESPIEQDPTVEHNVNSDNHEEFPLS